MATMRISRQIDQHATHPGAGLVERAQLGPRLERPEQGLLGQVGATLATTGQCGTQRDQLAVLIPKEHLEVFAYAHMHMFVHAAHPPLVYSLAERQSAALAP